MEVSKPPAYEVDRSEWEEFMQAQQQANQTLRESVSWADPNLDRPEHEGKDVSSGSEGHI